MKDGRLPALLVKITTFSPVLLSVVLMLPRLRSAEFGLLDDVNTISLARQLVAGDWIGLWEASHGRSRPIHWLFNTLIYKLAGADPVWFYVANTLLFAAITAGLIGFMIRFGRSRFQAGIAGLFFILSGPVVESFYTLSKPEPLQTALLVASLLLLVVASRPMGMLKRGVVLSVTSLVLLLADLTKEISIVVVPISAAWFLAAWWSQRHSPDRDGSKLKGLGAYFLASVISMGAFLALRSASIGLTSPSSSYADRYVVSLSRIIATAVRWSGWMIRDYAYIAPLVVLWLAWSFSRRRVHGGALLVGSLIWMGGWFAIYLPWRFAEEYYLLPFALGGAILSAILVDLLLREVSRSGTGWRASAWIGLTLAVVLLATLMANDVSNARLQVAIDTANAEVLRYIAGEIPSQARVVVNIQERNQYSVEFALHLDRLYNRPDLVVEPFQPQEAFEGMEAGGRRYVVTPLAQNLPLLRTRGPGASEEKAESWGASMHEYFGDTLKPIYRVERQFRLGIVDLPRLFCPLMPRKGYCLTDSPILDRRVFRYGWEVFEVVEAASARPGFPPDVPSGFGGVQMGSAGISASLSTVD